MTTVNIEGEQLVISPTSAQALLDIRAWNRDHRGAAYPRGAVHPATRQRLIGQGLIEDRPGGLVITARGVRADDQLDEEARR